MLRSCIKGALVDRESSILLSPLSSTFSTHTHHCTRRGLTNTDITAFDKFCPRHPHPPPPTMSSPYATQYYATSHTLPIAVPTAKGQYTSQYPSFYPSGESTYSVSPPEGDASVSSGSAMVPSYSNSGYLATASYASSSQGDFDSAGSASGIDFNEYMQERFADSFDPLPLDKCMAVQAQTWVLPPSPHHRHWLMTKFSRSGHLNAKQRELVELQAKAQARLAKSRARFAEGLQDARDVRSDLEWTQKKVS